MECGEWGTEYGERGDKSALYPGIHGKAMQVNSNFRYNVHVHNDSGLQTSFSALLH